MMRSALPDAGRISSVRHPTMDRHAYEIRVRGELTYALSNALASMGWTVAASRGSTTIRGCVRDQVELRGILDSLSNISLELLEVHQIEDTDGTP